VDYDRRVEQCVLQPKRRADDDDWLQRGAVSHDLLERRDRRSQQRVLVEEIVDAVGRDPELGEHHERGMCVRGLLREADRPLRVEGRLGHA
jgi:hypothetical protein